MTREEFRHQIDRIACLRELAASPCSVAKKREYDAKANALTEKLADALGVERAK
jgi:hypothetical protein